jgi:chemotaxis protein histidine kinase CheA
MFDGDADFVDDLAAQFTSHCLVALNDIHEALDAGDTRGVSRAAHTLKGSVGYFDPGTGHAIVEAIEHVPAGELGLLASLVGALEIRIDRLTHYLAGEFRTATVLIRPVSPDQVLHVAGDS